MDRICEDGMHVDNVAPSQLFSRFLPETGCKGDTVWSADFKPMEQDPIRQIQRLLAMARPLIGGEHRHAMSRVDLMARNGLNPS
jgi:hypothetical protein